MTAFQRHDRVRHDERGIGTVLAADDSHPCVGQSYVVWFDEPDATDSHAVSIPEVELEHADR